MLTEVAEGVLVHRSELLRNNTVVVRGQDGVLVVDAGITGAEMACLANDLSELGLPVVAGFSTHPDWDHVLWHADLGEAPRYGTARCAADMRDLGRDRGLAGPRRPGAAAGDRRRRPAGPVRPRHRAARRDRPDPVGRPGRADHRAPGALPGHAALLVEARRVLAAGDMLSDVFVPMLGDFTDESDPVEEYLAGLRLLEDVAGDVGVLVPGHGSAVAGDGPGTRPDRPGPRVPARAAGRSHP